MKKSSTFFQENLFMQYVAPFWAIPFLSIVIGAAEIGAAPVEQYAGCSIQKNMQGDTSYLLAPVSTLHGWQFYEKPFLRRYREEAFALCDHACFGEYEALNNLQQMRDVFWHHWLMRKIFAVAQEEFSQNVLACALEHGWLDSDFVQELLCIDDESEDPQ